MSGATPGALGFSVSGRAFSAAAALAVALAALASLSSPTEESEGALRLAFFGDSGTGNPDQKAVARQLRRFEKDLRHVFLLGDNVYWSGRSERFEYCVVDSLGRTRDHGSWSKSEREIDDVPLDPGRRRAVCEG